MVAGTKNRSDCNCSCAVAGEPEELHRLKPRAPRAGLLCVCEDEQRLFFTPGLIEPAVGFVLQKRTSW